MGQIAFDNERYPAEQTRAILERVEAALGISATTNPAAGVEILPRLRGCDMRLTRVSGPGEEADLRKLGILFTTRANPTSKGYFLRQPREHEIGLRG